MNRQWMNSKRVKAPVRLSRTSCVSTSTGECPEGADKEEVFKDLGVECRCSGRNSSPITLLRWMSTTSYLSNSISKSYGRVIGSLL